MQFSWFGILLMAMTVTIGQARGHMPDIYTVVWYYGWSSTESDDVMLVGGTIHCSVMFPVYTAYKFFLSFYYFSIFYIYTFFCIVYATFNRLSWSRPGHTLKYRNFCTLQEDARCGPARRSEIKNRLYYW